VENKTVEMVVKDLLLADNRKKKKKKDEYLVGTIRPTVLNFSKSFRSSNK